MTMEREKWFINTFLAKLKGFSLIVHGEMILATAMVGPLMKLNVY